MFVTRGAAGARSLRKSVAGYPGLGPYRIDANRDASSRHYRSHSCVESAMLETEGFDDLPSDPDNEPVWDRLDGVVLDGLFRGARHGTLVV